MQIIISQNFELFHIKIDFFILLLYTICVILLPFGGNSLGKEMESENSNPFR